MMTFEKMNIWIDFDNSPHVPFFAPIIRELKRLGYNITLTARDCFQVCGLADLYGFNYSRIGKHYGKNKAIKVAGTLFRSLQLLSVVSRFKPNLALSHGSRSQFVASKMLRIRSGMISDYEYTKWLPFIKPDFVLVPELIFESMKSRAIHSITYPGIKEDVYVPDFVPDSRTLEALSLDCSRLLITIRPPATEAHYHNPEADGLFAELINFFGKQEDVQMVILPRNEKKQGDYIKSRWSKFINSRKIIIPEHVIDGLNLIWHSDLIVSGGGTMNREAAALGVPVYSIFRGTIGAIDQYLSNTGRLILIEKPEDVRSKIKLIKRNKAEKPGRHSRKALLRIVDVIDQIVQTNQYNI